MPRPKEPQEYDAMRDLLHYYLRSGSRAATAASSGEHLDEDRLAAFIEGRLTEGESAPVIRHVATCSICRHATASLFRLPVEADEDEAESIRRPERRSIPSIPDFLPSAITSSAPTVFAYQDPTKDDEHNEEKGATKPPDDEKHEG
jgi:hypothetical protein